MGSSQRASDALAIPARPARGCLRGNRATAARLIVSFYPEAPYRFGMKTIIISLGVLCAFAVFADAQDVTKATVTLEPKSGTQVTGTVTFTKTGDDVHVVADVQNLKL